jgi:hypothetical protein
MPSQASGLKRKLPTTERARWLRIKLALAQHPNSVQTYRKRARAAERRK